MALTIEPQGLSFFIFDYCGIHVVAEIVTVVIGDDAFGGQRHGVGRSEVAARGGRPQGGLAEVAAGGGGGVAVGNHGHPAVATRVVLVLVLVKVGGQRAVVVERLLLIRLHRFGGSHNFLLYLLRPFDAFQDEIGRVVVRGDGEANVVEEVDHLVDVAEVRRLAVAQQQQLVEHVEDLRGGLMNRDDQRLALLLGVPLEAGHEHVGRVGVQARGGLVEQHEGWVGEQLARDVGPLLLAAGQPALGVVTHPRVLARVQVQDVDDVVHVDHLLAARHGLGQPEARRVLQGLPQRQVGEEDVLLQDVADAPLPPLGQALPVQADASRVQLGAARQAVQEGCLATTGGPHDGQHLAGPDDAGHVPQDAPGGNGDAEAAEDELERPGAREVGLALLQQEGAVQRAAGHLGPLRLDDGGAHHGGGPLLFLRETKIVLVPQQKQVLGNNHLQASSEQRKGRRGWRARAAGSLSAGRQGDEDRGLQGRRRERLLQAHVGGAERAGEDRRRCQTDAASSSTRTRVP